MLGCVQADCDAATGKCAWLAGPRGGQRAASPHTLVQDFWGFDFASQLYGPIPICSGGTITFRWHSEQGVAQVSGPGVCPSTTSAGPDSGAGAWTTTLLPVQQGTRTAMYIWTDPGTPGPAEYYFTSPAGDECAEGAGVQEDMRVGERG